MARGLLLVMLLGSARLAAETVVGPSAEVAGTELADKPEESISASRLWRDELNDQQETPWLEDEPLKTETVDVEMISPDEFKPAIQKYYPQMIRKRQVEALAANSPHVLLPHRPNYVMPFTYQSSPNNQEVERLFEHYSADDTSYDGGFDHVEVVMQFSIKYELLEGILTKLDRLEVAYTNRSYWQAYNSDISRPFRETNHEPEIIYSWQPGIDWLDRVGIGLNHQSNGQTSSLSRSWNRVILEGASAFSHGIWMGKVWWRIPEGKQADPYDPSDNDNPDIEDYLGYGELRYMRVYGQRSVGIMLRNNLDTTNNRGAVEMDFTFPLTRKLKGFVQYFNGYGDSLIDYNHWQERLGVGIKLTDWL
ncbi:MULTISPECIES: phospholipase A [unclassified Oceanobacter]|uniref:phospholipase A n=1 Tax=unclassified Oceanobacter TaxID=2620260 RepID=UPI00273626D6|nr:MULTISPECIES: phospholipase A [unclassified Oceanobacter]MDP2506844.1 phospholipase A [Oceanobacter sp. 3_MG-2023]MDP2547847.1 phospholipase A [Oceanobacter sp. 4_MG-2023]